MEEGSDCLQKKGIVATPLNQSIEDRSIGDCQRNGKSAN
jgi:hypothetical protein